jgi:hypothetical protein
MWRIVVGQVLRNTSKHRSTTSFRVISLFILTTFITTTSHSQLQLHFTSEHPSLPVGYQIIISTFITHHLTTPCLRAPTIHYSPSHYFPVLASHPFWPSATHSHTHRTHMFLLHGFILQLYDPANKGTTMIPTGPKLLAQRLSQHCSMTLRSHDSAWGDCFYDADPAYQQALHTLPNLYNRDSSCVWDWPDQVCYVQFRAHTMLQALLSATGGSTYRCIQRPEWVQQPQLRNVHLHIAMAVVVQIMVICWGFSTMWWARFVWILWITHCHHLDTDWTHTSGCLSDMVEEHVSVIEESSWEFGQSCLQKVEERIWLILSQWELWLPKVTLFRASNSGVCEDSTISAISLCTGFICQIPSNLTT